MCCGDNDGVSVVSSMTGEKGDIGLNGWSPLLAVVEDGERRVHRIIGYTGGTDVSNKPPYTNYYLANGIPVANIASATDIRGATGATGAAGVGTNAWIMLSGNVVDGVRIVQQVIDWFGGTGTKPAIGAYIGATGLVTDIANATNIRGATGATGAAGVDTTDGRTKIDSGDTHGYLENKVTGSNGVSIIKSGGIGSRSLDYEIAGLKYNPNTFMKSNSDGTGVQYATFDMQRTAADFGGALKGNTSGEGILGLTTGGGSTRGYLILAEVNIAERSTNDTSYMKLLVDGVQVDSEILRTGKGEGFRINQSNYSITALVNIPPNKYIQLVIQTSNSNQYEFYRCSLTIMGVPTWG